MGENCAELAGFSPQVIGDINNGNTIADDTIKIARLMVKTGVDLLLFAGGDGTARNIYDSIGTKIPVLGIPAGVKIHSAVYAVNPRSAGKAVSYYLEGRTVDFKEAEVMDIDEVSFRQGNVKAKLYGFLKVPEIKAYIQNVKSGGYSEKEAVAGMAAEVTENMKNDILYIIGPGTTTRSIMNRLKLSNTLIGVDLVQNRQVLASDVNEKQLYNLLGDKKARIIVTAIGGQGHIFGRGNQQLSPRVIRKVGKKNIIVVASKDKLISLKSQPLLVDTADLDLDRELCGYIRVITGFEDYVPYNVST
jgi:predicted polyphosphate/ATP-dependent NAD kinase